VSTPAYKKRARQLEHIKQKKQREFEKMLASIPKPSKKEFKEYVPSSPVIRETPDYPSLSSQAIPAGGAKKESQKYTGDYIIGIATMHKSNLVPVGRGDNPEEYAKMRRN
jgi:hypothetical protein